MKQARDRERDRQGCGAAGFLSLHGPEGRNAHSHACLIRLDESLGRPFIPGIHLHATDREAVSGNILCAPSFLQCTETGSPLYAGIRPDSEANQTCSGE